MRGSPIGSSRSGGLRLSPTGGDGPERAYRVGDDVDGWQLELIKDVAQERPTVLEQIDALVVEGIGHAVTRPVDCEHAVGLRESREDRYHLERAA